MSSGESRKGEISRSHPSAAACPSIWLLRDGAPATLRMALPFKVDVGLSSDFLFLVLGRPPRSSFWNWTGCRVKVSIWVSEPQNTNSYRSADLHLQQMLPCSALCTLLTAFWGHLITIIPTVQRKRRHREDKSLAQGPGSMRDRAGIWRWSPQPSNVPFYAK